MRQVTVKEWALAALGADPTNVQHKVMGAPTFIEARANLAKLKTEAKRRYKRLALDLHPDRTGGDESKAARFRELTEAMDALEAVELRERPRPAPIPVAKIEFNGFSSSASTTGSGYHPGHAYQYRRVYVDPI